jgi:hypothetical protein
MTQTPYHYGATKVVDKFGILCFYYLQICVFMHQGQ